MKTITSFLKQSLGFAVLSLLSITVVFAEDSNILVIDDMENFFNSLGSKCAMYQKEPSKALFSKIGGAGYSSDKSTEGENRGLKIVYMKKGKGGPWGNGGWCGFYTVLRTGKKYLDVSDYSKFTMMVKGSKGGENFLVGFSDPAGEKRDDPQKSNCATDYLASGKITTEWQKLEISLDELPIDWSMIHSMAVGFDTSCFAKGGQKGIVYFDNFQFEK